MDVGKRETVVCMIEALWGKQNISLLDLRSGHFYLHLLEMLEQWDKKGVYHKTDEDRLMCTKMFLQEYYGDDCGSKIDDYLKFDLVMHAEESKIDKKVFELELVKIAVVLLGIGMLDKNSQTFMSLVMQVPLEKHYVVLAIIQSVVQAGSSEVSLTSRIEEILCEAADPQPVRQRGSLVSWLQSTHNFYNSLADKDGGQTLPMSPIRPVTRPSSPAYNLLESHFLEPSQTSTPKQEASKTRSTTSKAAPTDTGHASPLRQNFSLLNTSLRDITSPLRSLSIDPFSPHSPLMQFAQSPQLIQKAILRQKETELRKLRRQVEEQTDRADELKYLLQDQTEVVSQKDTTISRLERKVQDLQRQNFQRELQDSTDADTEATISHLRQKVESMEQYKTQVDILEKESKSNAEELRKLYDEIDVLEKKNGEYQAQLESNNRQDESMEGRRLSCAVLSEQLEQLQKAKLAWDEDRSAMQATIDALRERNACMKHELDDLQPACAGNTSGETMGVVLDIQMEEMRCQFEKATRDNEALQSQLDRNQASLGQREDEVRRLQAELCELQEKLAKSDSLAAQQSRDLVKATETFEEKAQELSRLESVKAELEQEKEDLESELEEEKKRCSSRSEEVAKLTSDLSRREDEIAKMAEVVEAKSSELSKCCDAIAEKDVRLQELVSSLEAAREANRLASEDLASREAEISRLGQELKEQLEQVRAESWAREGELRAELEEARRAMAELENGHTAQLTSLKDRHCEEVRGFAQTAEVTRDELLSLRASDSRKSAELVELRAKLEAISQTLELKVEEVSEKNVYIDNLKQGVSEKDISIDNLKQEVSEKDMNIDNLKQEVVKKDAYIDNLKRKVSEKDINMGNLKQEVSEKDFYIDNLKQEVSEKDTTIDNLKQEVSEKGVYIDNLKQDCESQLGGMEQNKCELQALIEKLQKQLDEMIQQFQAVECELEIKKVEICEKEKKIGCLKCEFEEKLDAAQENKRAALEGLKTELDTRREIEVQTLSGKMSEMEAVKSKELACLEGKISAMQDEIKSLNSKLEETKLQLHDAREQLSSKSAAILEKENALRHLAEDFEVQRTAAELRSQTALQEIQSRLESANESHAHALAEQEKAQEEEVSRLSLQHTEEMNKILESMEQKGSDLAVFQKTISEKTAELNELKSELKAANSSLQARSVEVSGQQEQVAGLEQALLEKEGLITSLREDFEAQCNILQRDAKTALGNLQSKLEAAKEKELQDTVAELTATHKEEIETQRLRLEAEVDAIKAKIEAAGETHKAEIESQRLQFEAENQAAVVALKEEISAAHTADINATTDAHKNEVKTQRLQFEAEIEALKAKIEALKAKIKAAEEAHNTDIESHRLQSEAEVDALKAKMVAAEETHKAHFNATTDAHKAEIESCRLQFEAQISDNKNEMESQRLRHETEMNAATSAHKEEVDSQRLKFATEIQAATDAHKAEMEQRLSAAQRVAEQGAAQGLEGVQEEHARVVESLRLDWDKERDGYLQSMLAKRQEAERLTSDLKELQGQLDVSEEQSRSHMQELEKAQQRFAEAEAKHAEETAQLQSKLASLAAVEESLGGEVGRLKQALADAEWKFGEANTLSESRAQELETTRGVLTKASQDLEAAEDVKQELHKQIGALQSRLDGNAQAQAEEVQALTQKLSEKKLLVTRLGEEVQQKSAALVSLEKTVADQGARLAGLQQSVGELTSSLDAKTRDVVQQEKLVEELRLEVSGKEELVAELKETFEEQRLSAQQENKALIEQLELKFKAARESELKTLADQKLAHEADIEKLISEKDEKLRELESQKYGLESLTENLQCELKENKKNISDRDKELELFGQRMFETEALFFKLKGDLDKATEDIGAYETTITYTNTELQIMKSKLQEKTEEVLSKEEIIDQMKQDFEVELERLQAENRTSLEDIHTGIEAARQRELQKAAEQKQVLEEEYRRKLEELQSNMTSEKAELAGEIAQLRSQKETLEATDKSRQSLQEQSQSLLSQREEENAELCRKVEQLEHAGKAYLCQRDEIQASLQRKESEAAQLHAKIGEAELGWKEQCESLQDRLRQREADSADLEAKTQRLQEVEAAMRAQREQDVACLREREGEVESLMRDLAEEQQAKACEVDRAEALSAQLLKLQAQAESLERKLADEKTKNVTEEQDRKAMHERNSQLENENVSLKESSESLKNSLRSEKETCQKKKKQLADMTLEFQTTQKENKQYASEVNRLKTALDLSERKLKACQKQLETAGTALLGDSSHFQQIITTSSDDSPMDSPDRRGSGRSLRSRSRLSSGNLNETVVSTDSIFPKSDTEVNAAALKNRRTRSHRGAEDRMSICSTFSAHSSSSSTGIHGVPLVVGGCENEPDEQNYNWDRLNELSRRNTMYLPHLKSAYPVETQAVEKKRFSDDNLRLSLMADKNFRKDGQLMSPPVASHGTKSSTSVNSSRANLSRVEAGTSGGKTQKRNAPLELLKEDVSEASPPKQRRPPDASPSGTIVFYPVVRTAPNYHRPGPPTPGKQPRRVSGTFSPNQTLSPVSAGSSQALGSPITRAHARVTPKARARRSPRIKASPVPVQDPRRQSVAFNIGFSPLAGQGPTRPPRQAGLKPRKPTNTVSMSSKSSSKVQESTAAQKFRRPLGVRNFLETGI